MKEEQGSDDVTGVDFMNDEAMIEGSVKEIVPTDELVNLVTRHSQLIYSGVTE